MARVFGTIGLPGSGKSTWCRKQMEYYQARKFSCVYINGDDLRRMLYAGEYRFDRNMQEDLESVIIEMAERFCRTQDYIFVDEALLTIDTAGCRSLAQGVDSDHAVEFIYFNTPIDICKYRRRIDSRGKPAGYWDDVIDYHNEKLNPDRLNIVIIGDLGCDWTMINYES